MPKEKLIPDESQTQQKKLKLTNKISSTIKISLVLFLFLILAIIALTGSFYYSPSLKNTSFGKKIINLLQNLNIIPKSPQELINDMFTKLSSVKIFHEKTTFTGSVKINGLNNLLKQNSQNFSPFLANLGTISDQINITPNNQNNINNNIQAPQPINANLSMFIDEAVDISNAHSPKSSANIDLKLEFEGISFNINADLIYIDQKYYLKMNKFPLIGIIDVSYYQNKWIEIDPVKLAKTPYIQNFQNQAITQDRLPKDFAIYINELFRNKTLFILQLISDNENLNNIAAYHIAYEIDKIELQSFITDLFKKISGNLRPSTSTNYNLQNYDKNISTLMQSVKTINGDLWIGKKDNLPYKATFNADIAFHNPISNNQMTTGSLLLNITTEFSGYNKPVTISQPKESSSINDIINELAGGVVSTQLNTSTSPYYNNTNK